MCHEVEVPETKLRINGVDSIYGDGLTLIGGQRKQGKSHALLILASVMLSGNKFGSIERGSTRVKRCAWFDTEQSAYFQRQNLKRLYELCGIQTVSDTSCIKLDYYGLSPVSVKHRLSIINEVMESRSPDLIIIDQLGDLINDTNDLCSSVRLYELLSSLWSRHRGLSIMATLHDNPGGEKSRGHLGTMMEHKANEKYNVMRESDGVFTVENVFSRGEMSAPWCFTFDLNDKLKPYQNPPVSCMNISPRDVIPCGLGTTFSQAVDNLMRLLRLSHVKRDEARREMDKLQREWIRDGLITRRGNMLSLN